MTTEKISIISTKKNRDLVGQAVYAPFSDENSHSLKTFYQTENNLINA